MDRGDICITGGNVRSMKKSKQTMFCVEAPVGETTTNCVLKEDKPNRDLTINNIDLTAYVTHLHYFFPFMYTLHHIAKKVYNTAVELWVKRAIMSFATAVGPLFRDSAWIVQHT